MNDKSKSKTQLIAELAEMRTQVSELGKSETRRKAAEEALYVSEEKYRVLTESMKDVIVQLSPTGKVLYVSPAIKEFGGYDPKSEIGNHLAKYFENKTDVIRASKLLANVIITRQGGRFEFEFKPKNKKSCRK